YEPCGRLYASRTCGDASPTRQSVELPREIRIERANGGDLDSRLRRLADRDVHSREPQMGERRPGVGEDRSLQERARVARATEARERDAEMRQQHRVTGIPVKRCLQMLDRF